MIAALIYWLISLMAGSGIYGAMGDQVGYQSDGTGTFGFDNDTIRFFWAGISTILLRYAPVMLAELAKKLFGESEYWPAIQKFLEMIKLLTPKENDVNPVQAGGHAGTAKQACNNLADYFADCKCDDGIKKATGLLEHVYELEMKEESK